MALEYPRKVTVYEVGPRDGLQNEKVTVPTEVKVKYIDLLADSGLSVIEATSFVSPRAIPQLADATDVMRQVERKPGCAIRCLCRMRAGWNAHWKLA